MTALSELETQLVGGAENTKRSKITSSRMTKERAICSSADLSWKCFRAKRSDLRLGRKQCRHFVIGDSRYGEFDLPLRDSERNVVAGAQQLNTAYLAPFR